MKIIALIFSLFSLINNKINIKCQYEKLSNIEYIYDDYKVIEREEDIEILYKEDRLDLLTCKYNYKILYDNNILVVFYKNSIDDYLKIKKYEKGKNTITKIFDNKFVNTFDVIQYKTSYIFVSSIDEYENETLINLYKQKEYLSNRDAIIIEFNEKLEMINYNILGGTLNDYFSKIYINNYDESIYIIGGKDQNSGYDFGYGGNGVKGYLFVQIDSSLQINNYLVFKESIKNLEFNDSLTIFTLNNIYSLDYDLNIISSLKLGLECIFGYTMSNNYICVFGQNNLKIYDYLKNVLLDSYDYKGFSGVDSVEIKNDFVYLRGRDTIYKAIFYDSSLENKQFVYDTKELDNTNLNIIGIPNDYNVKSISYEEGYNRSIFGIYNMTLEYEYFNINCEMQILPRCNIINDYIYPLGYNIKFSGNAYLNGLPIDNNYPVTEEGEYQLILCGKSEEIKYNFKVYDMDVNYKEEDLKYWDYELYQNQVLSYKLKYNNNYNINYVIVNGEEYNFEVDYQEKEINLYFSETESGLYSYYIDKIIYTYNNKEYYEYINQNIFIKVLSNKISLDNNYYNNEKEFIFSIHVLDNYDIRFIKVLSNDYDEKYCYIPIKEGNINIKDLNLNNSSIISFYIMYDVGGLLYEEQLLFKLEYNLENLDKSGIIGTMQLNKTEDKVQELTFKFDYNDNLNKIIIGEEIKFVNDLSKDYSLIYASVIITFILFGIGKTIKTINKSNKTIKKKKNKTT